jgi:carbon monoxide dehydrogenase subunit G
MAAYRFSVTIRAPIELVYDLWTDLALMKDWVGGVTRVTDVTGPVDQAGTTYTTWFGSMASRTEVLEAERPRLYHTRFAGRILSGENRSVLQAEGTATRLTEEFRIGGGIAAAVFGRIFATGSYKGSFRGELNEFAKLAEREALARSAVAPGSGVGRQRGEDRER